MKPHASRPVRPGKQAARRGSPVLLAPSKRLPLVRSTSIKSFSRTMAPDRPIERKAIPVFPVPPSSSEAPCLTVSYRSCSYTFRPRPSEFSSLVEQLKSTAVFTGEPVMTFRDTTGKLKYMTDYHEMTRAYRDHPTHLTVDLRFD